MDKIIQYVKKNYRMLIPVMVVLVLLVTVYFLYREYKYDNYRNKQEVDVYQYFGGVKNEYKAIVTYNLDDKIVDITSKDKSVEYDSTPVYYKDKKQVLFPSEMNIVFPLKEGSQLFCNYLRTERLAWQFSLLKLLNGCPDRLQEALQQHLFYVP